ncbi:hypothetical protein Gohar_018772 [Gossypium harknessii]|uniref:DUF4283 domain-containing protein n=1 Tax=Gossypium harknessii TaxID=34285 RepID=A0A7J9GBE6_9ROSI|nr:hypothetical protein [Gossypium harknessii]
MAWTVIVKLLERRISYLTMSNKLQAIWKTKQPLQIIDLENDYFSVKFQEDNEYLDALFKGPWTIFGHYLTVWRWTPDFSTDQCGRFGHNRENCPHKTGQGSASEVEVNQQLNQDDILQGLSNEVGDVIAMVDVLGKEIEEEDKTIVDVEST